MALTYLSCAAVLYCVGVATAHSFLKQPKDEFTEGLFEGDIRLTEEQKVMMEQRNALPDLSTRWPGYDTGDVNIPYRFGDDVLDQALVLKGIAEFEEHTCLTFTEVASGHSVQHMVFFNSDGEGCYSYIGRTSLSQHSNGQPIKYTSYCAKILGTVIHEICHALGLRHEQSRSDRNEHVEIKWENIKTGKGHNFNRGDTVNYDTEYDYLSLMHYGNSGFSKNGQYTIVTLNPLVQAVIGSRTGFSFMNKRLVNVMHGCINKWLTTCNKEKETCQNQGYTGKTCACVCPVGTSGTECETRVKPYQEAAVQEVEPDTGFVYTEGILSSPGYPGGRPAGISFVKVVKAPECHTIKYTFSDFKLDDVTNCVTEYLVITSDTSNPITKNCGLSIAAGHIEESDGDTLIFVFEAHSSYASTFDGFNGTIEHVPTPGCVPEETTTLLQKCVKVSQPSLLN